MWKGEDELGNKFMKRTKDEIEARVDLVRLSGDFSITMAYDEAELATRGKSPSSAFRLAYKIALRTLSVNKALAVAKSVRWARILERDF